MYNLFTVNHCFMRTFMAIVSLTQQFVRTLPDIFSERDICLLRISRYTRSGFTAAYILHFYVALLRLSFRFSIKLQYRVQKDCSFRFKHSFQKDCLYPNKQSSLLKDCSFRYKQSFVKDCSFRTQC